LRHARPAHRRPPRRRPQLKKSLRILDEPADARSAVEAPHFPSSDEEDDEELGDAPGSPSNGGGDAAAAEPPHGVDPDQEARFVSLVEACVQELNEDYLSREEMMVIKADLVASSAAAAGGDAPAALAAYRAAVDLHGELVLLCHWSMMAYTGIVKVRWGRRSRRRGHGCSAACRGPCWPRRAAAGRRSSGAAALLAPPRGRPPPMPPLPRPAAAADLEEALQAHRPARAVGAAGQPALPALLLPGGEGGPSALTADSFCRPCCVVACSQAAEGASI
jgi:hypothetical protein